MGRGIWVRWNSQRDRQRKRQREKERGREIAVGEGGRNRVAI